MQLFAIFVACSSISTQIPWTFSKINLEAGRAFEFGTGPAPASEVPASLTASTGDAGLSETISTTRPGLRDPCTACLSQVFEILQMFCKNVEGSFSAASKPIFARVYSFCSILKIYSLRRSKLTICRECVTILQSVGDVFRTFATIAELSLRLSKNVSILQEIQNNCRRSMNLP